MRAQVDSGAEERAAGEVHANQSALSVAGTQRRSLARRCSGMRSGHLCADSACVLVCKSVRSEALNNSKYNAAAATKIAPSQISEQLAGAAEPAAEQLAGSSDMGAAADAPLLAMSCLPSCRR